MKTCFILVLYLFASIFSGYADLIGIQNDLSTDTVKEKKEESFVRVPLAKSTNLVSQLVKGMLPNSSSTTPAKENDKLQKDISPSTTKLDQVNVNQNSKETEVKTDNSIGSTTKLPEIKQGSTVKQQPAVTTKLPQSQEQPAVTTKLPQSSRDATGKVHVNNDIKEESSLSEKVKEVSKEDPSNTETKNDVQKTEKQTTRNQPVNTSVASQQRDNERLTYKLLTSQMTTRLTTNFQEIKASTTQYAGVGSTTAIPEISNDKDFLLQSNEEELDDGNKDLLIKNEEEDDDKDMLQTNEKDSEKDGTEDGDLDHWNGDNVNLNVDEDINDNDEFWDDDTSDKDLVSNYDYNGDDVTPGKVDNEDNNKIELTTTVANVESGSPDKNLMDDDDSFDDFNSVADKTGDFWDEMTVNKNPLIKDKFVTKNFKSPFAEDMRMFGFYSWVLFITVMLLILFVFFTQQRHRCGMLSGFRFRNRKTSVSSEEGKSLIKNVYT